jgi:choline monooxygenase
MDTLIPPLSYHDPAVFAAEQQMLFGRIWNCVGFQHEVAQHNDFVTRDVGGQSVVVHNFNGGLRAFHNVCSHRFNRIHPAGKGNRPLQCSYHGWTYDEAGLPSAIPKRPRFDDLTPEKICALRLKPWQVETCGQLVFVP